MKKTIILLGLTYIMITWATAQTTESNIFEEGYIIGEFGINFDVSIPQGSFGEQQDIGLGMSGIALFGSSKFPVKGGIETGFGVFDRVRQDVDVVIGNFVEEYELRTSSKIFFINGVLRLSPTWNFPVTPYADGIFGTKRLHTGTTLERQGFNNGEDDNDDTQYENNQSDWTYNYGGAVGLKVRLSPSEEAGDPTLYLNASVSYIRGGNADYMVELEDQSGIQEPIEAFELRNSTTDLLIPRLGFILQF